VSLERKIFLLILGNLYTHGTLRRQGFGGHARLCQGFGGHARPEGFCKNLNKLTLSLFPFVQTSSFFVVFVVESLSPFFR
jgi:hypothetical protein